MNKTYKSIFDTTRSEITRLVLKQDDSGLDTAWAKVLRFLDEKYCTICGTPICEDPNEHDRGSHQDQAPEDF